MISTSRTASTGPPPAGALDREVGAARGRVTPPGTRGRGARTSSGLERLAAEVADEVLARRAGLGDREAFAALVDRHGPALYRYAARMLDDPSETSDCLQDALGDAWRGLPGFRGQASVRTWLFTLVAHAVRRYQRRHLARTPRPVDDEVFVDLPAASKGSGDPADVVESNDFVAALDAALHVLPAGQREVWLLREVEDFSYADIARVRAVPVDAVRGQLARARAGLKMSMEAWR